MPIADMATYMKNRRLERRAFALNLLGGRCCRCGSIDNLEFDHIDANSKSEKIANMLSHSMEKLLAELDKCQILCHDCHVQKTLECGDNLPR